MYIHETQGKKYEKKNRESLSNLFCKLLASNPPTVGVLSACLDYKT